MNRVDITEADDPRLADYVRLRETALRRRMETEHGLFIAEGTKVIERALGAGYQPRSFLMSARWLPQLAGLIAQHPTTPVYVVSEELVEQVTGFHVHRGALASVHRHLRHTVQDLLECRRLVVCEDIVDHTNVGAIMRCAAGLGWDGVLLAPRAADPLYRRSIKVSMGSVFNLPWARMSDWHAAVPMLQEAGFRCLALALSPDAVDLAHVHVADHDRIAILLGTEGAGLSDHWRDAADEVVRIPMTAGIDSLNVAAAAAIACYALGDSVTAD